MEMTHGMETWELFEFSMTPPTPVGNFSQVSALLNFEGSPKMEKEEEKEEKLKTSVTSFL